jgi:WD40 repeat protein
LSHNSGVTTARYLDDYIVCSSGASDGLVKFWDIRGTLRKPFQVFNPNASAKRVYGINSIDFDKRKNFLYCSLLSNKILALDIAKLEVVETFEHNLFENASYYCSISLSPCGEYLASGSMSSDVFVWSTEERRLYTLQGHRSEVTCVNWGQHDYKLISCSDDGTVRTWEIPPTLKDPTSEPLVGFVKELTLPPLPSLATDTNVSQEDTENREISLSPSAIQSDWFAGQDNTTNPITARSLENSARPPVKKRKITDYFRPINHDR